MFGELLFFFYRPKIAVSYKAKKSGNLAVSGQIWLRGKDLNQRPPGYELPSEVKKHR